MELADNVKPYESFLQGGGEMGKLIRSIDWSKTPIGSPDTWSDSLKYTISIILSTPFPMYIAWGTEFTQLYNDGYRPILGSTKHPQAMGASTKTTFAEIWDTIGPMFENVMKGEAVLYSDHLLPLDRNGAIENCYFNFSYSPIHNRDGSVGGVLVTVIETTEQRKALDSLKESQLALEASRAELQKERDKLKRFFMQAPAGICILDGEDLVFELVNPAYQQLFPGRALLGKPVLEAVPEIQGQPIHDTLLAVYNGGRSYEGKALLIPLARTPEGPVEERYFDFIYQARLDAQNKIDGIMVFVYEVTDQIVSTRELVQTEQTLQLAIDTAELGLWKIDVQTGILILSDRARQMHGIKADVDITLDQALQMIRADQRDRIKNALERASRLKESFDEEYLINPLDGSKPKWLKSMAKVYNDEQGSAIIISGTTLDITEQKLDELRKNDFISMVSHEMKTPLTSLNGYLQMLQGKAIKGTDNFTEHALDKSVKQVKKLTTMINGFLNVSRIESSKIHLEPQKFIINDLIKESIDDAKALQSSHTLTFSSDGSIMICADRDKIGSVISNFINNAMKYSPKGTSIVVQCKKERNNEVMVSVKDHGVGIEKEDANRLFERFYRVQNQETRHIAGFGIGLYLGAEIIERHGGQIGVDSEPGKGSTFWFKLPIETKIK